MEKTKLQRYLEYIEEWFKSHSLQQRIGDYNKAKRERPLTMVEWLVVNDHL